MSTSVTTLLESLFRKELSGSNWRKYTCADMIELIREKAVEIGVSLTDPRYILLQRSMSRCHKPEAALTVLSNALLGEAL